MAENWQEENSGDVDEDVSEEEEDDSGMMDEEETLGNSEVPVIFRTALDSEPFRIRTLKELAMVRLSSSIRSKPEWWLKRTVPRIEETWKREALEARLVWLANSADLVSESSEVAEILPQTTVTLEEEHVDYVLGELDGYARLRDEETGIEVGCFDGIWRSDRLIPPDLREALIQGVAPLENVPESKKDWHPYTHKTVLDLVHPTLYCFMYKKTPVYTSLDPSTRKLSTLPPPELPEDPTRLDKAKTSRRFQWLPTDFFICEDGTSTHALGYINNLHPSHKDLYRTIERALALFVPMFEKVLTDMLQGLPHRIPGEYGDIEQDPRYPQRPLPLGDSDMTLQEYYTSVDDFMDEIGEDETGKYIILPTLPPNGYAGGREWRWENYSLKGKKVQVIVKLANIHLTPRKPEYEGGSWHVEGMLNERIVATGIYYYDQENVTTNELAFRISVSQPQTAEKQATTYDRKAHTVTWGLSSEYSVESPMNQVIGAEETKPNRCIAFPNIFQHCVSPFELQDRTKPGHRKILVFFLIDPSIDPIPSTTLVPPQQPAWAIDDLVEYAQSPTSRLHKLPVEVLAYIAENMGRMTMEEAKKARLDFMKERSNFAGKMNEKVYEKTFNLCEH